MKNQCDDNITNEEETIGNMIELQEILLSILIHAHFYDINNNMASIVTLFQTFLKVKQQKFFSLKYFNRFLHFSTIIDANKDESRSVAKKTLVSIFSLYFNTTELSPFLLNNLMEFLKKKHNSYQVIYFLLKIIFESEQNIILNLEMNFSISSFLKTHLYTQRLEDKYANLFIQIILSLPNNFFSVFIPCLSKIYPFSLIIKSMIVSLYKIYSNKHKLLVCKDEYCSNLCPLIDNNIHFRIILKDCSSILKELLKKRKKKSHNRN